MWPLFVAFLLGLMPLANQWVEMIDTVHSRVKADGVEGELGVRVAGHLNEIVSLNRQLRLLNLKCPSVIMYPPAVAALRARGTYLSLRQSYRKMQIEFELNRHPGIVRRSPTFRGLPDPCGVPGQLRWTWSPLYSHRTSIAGVQWELSSTGWPKWSYSHPKVRIMP